MKKLLLAAVLILGTHSAFADQAYVNFGNVNVIGGTAQTQYVTLSNTDSTAMGPLEMASGCMLPDYDVSTNCPSTLPAQTSCQIYITFKPSHAGLFTCTIRIASENAPGESDIIVSGEGN